MLDYRQDFMILTSLLAQGFQIKASFALVFSFTQYPRLVYSMRRPVATDSLKIPATMLKSARMPIHACAIEQISWNRFCSRARLVSLEKPRQ